MINTIEVAPGILAASLAKALFEHYQVYKTVYDTDERQDEHELREFIRDFLTDKK